MTLLALGAKSNGCFPRLWIALPTATSCAERRCELPSNPASAAAPRPKPAVPKTSWKKCRRVSLFTSAAWNLLMISSGFMAVLFLGHRFVEVQQRVRKRCPGRQFGVRNPGDGFGFLHVLREVLLVS